MTDDIYRAGTIKRKRRTADEIDQLDQQITEVLREDHPQSVRHMFYRMTDPRLPVPVPKIDHGPNNGYRAVQDRIKKLRRDGRLSYGWISDSTRRGYHTTTYSGADDFLRRMAGLYRGDLWAQSQFYVEVWCESRSIAGVLEGTCRELAVSLYPCGGFSSITLAYEAAQMINWQCANGKDCVIYYIGDYDPAGVLIDQSLERELREHLNSDVKLHFIRLGITEQQIEEYDLPTKPRKATDRRAPHIKETVEAEAMPAHILRDLLRQNIEVFLPKDALEVVKVAEQSERDLLRQMADMIGGDE
ncbi:hypothetical protein [Paracoccus aestuariivivens]|uniref:DUF2399 domain-containing protein n=1 Tax=Paracoccus aestuariivivens TaxID=1820333 RepID=A0A6L6JC25_9RHOB|nr:hypothetical protein [Paracoccus aestuariivivens]MTH77561.1 hypothetical protein [Paracoccus aestuariivivens]